jgi:tRNA A37 N6-isopentenylltransferase MiaA
MIALPAALTGLNGKVIAALTGLLLIAGITLYVQHLRGTVQDLEASNAALRKDIDAALLAADSANLALQLANEDHARAIWIINREREAAVSRAERLAAARNEVANAKPEDDGPVGAVLLNLLERLRLEGAAAGRHPR